MARRLAAFLALSMLASFAACKAPESRTSFGTDTTRAQNGADGGSGSDDGSGSRSGTGSLSGPGRSGSSSSGSGDDGDAGGSSGGSGGGSDVRRTLVDPAPPGPASPPTAYTTTTTPAAPPVQDGAIVFADGPNADLHVIKGDGSQRQALGLAGHFPAWAPDKRRFAYSGAVPQFPQTRLFIFSLDQRSITPVGEYKDPAYLAWSPDGTRIAFVDRDASCLVVVRTDGTNPKCLDIPGGRPEFVSWSPNGSRLLFTQLSGGRWSTFSLDAKTFGDRRLELTDALYADARADGRFVFIRLGGENRHELWLAEAGGANARRIDVGAAIPQAPKWSATGKDFVAVLTYASNNHKLTVFNDTGASPRELGPCIDVADW